MKKIISKVDFLKQKDLLQINEDHSILPNERAIICYGNQNLNVTLPSKESVFRQDVIIKNISSKNITVLTSDNSLIEKNSSFIITPGKTYSFYSLTEKWKLEEKPLFFDNITSFISNNGVFFKNGNFFQKQIDDTNFKSGEENDKPELEGGESYYSEDSYKFYLGGGTNKPPFIVKGFPYYKMLTDHAGNLSFRYMIDGENGNDSNDGLSWENAKQTIQSAIDDLPERLEGYSCWIFVKAGHVETGTLDINKTNGIIKIQWIGDQFLLRSDSFKDFVVNGETLGTLGNDTITFDGNGNTALNFNSYGNMTLEFIAAGQTGLVYGAFTFKSSKLNSNPLLDLTLEVEGCKFSAHTMIVDFTNCSFSYGFYINYLTGVINQITVIGGGGTCCIQDGQWRGVFGIDTWVADIGKLNIGHENGVGSTWDSGFAPPAYIHTTDVKQLFSTANKIGDSLDFRPISQAYVDNLYSYGKPKGYIGSSAKNFIVGYDSTKFILTDNSISSKTLIVDGVTTVYLTKNISDDSINILFKNLPTSDPVKAGALWNSAGTVKISSGS